MSIQTKSNAINKGLSRILLEKQYLRSYSVNQNNEILQINVKDYARTVYPKSSCRDAKKNSMAVLRKKEEMLKTKSLRKTGSIAFSITSSMYSLLERLSKRLLTAQRYRTASQNNIG